MITLIGTGHVFDLQTQLIDLYQQIQPDVFCIELDKQRLQALIMKQNNPQNYKQVSKRLPFLYRLLSTFQERMAEKFGVNPGEEMITTLTYARDYHLPLLCIDMHAQTLFTRMIKSMTLKEKIRFLFSGVGGFFVRSEKVDTQIKTISKNVESYLDIIGKQFPTIKRILIDERNQYMVNNLEKVNKEYDTIVCIVGDGHIPGMTQLLHQRSIDHDVIRLHQLQDMPKKETDGSSAGFSVDYQQV